MEVHGRDGFLKESSNSMETSIQFDVPGEPGECMQSTTLALTSTDKVAHKIGCPRMESPATVPGSASLSGDPLAQRRLTVSEDHCLQIPRTDHSSHSIDSRHRRPYSSPALPRPEATLQYEAVVRIII